MEGLVNILFRVQRFTWLLWLVLLFNWFFCRVVFLNFGVWDCCSTFTPFLNFPFINRVRDFKKKLENTDFYTQLLNFESGQWHVAHAANLGWEGKLIKAGFEFVRYSGRDEVAIYRKRK